MTQIFYVSSEQECIIVCLVCTLTICYQEIELDQQKTYDLIFCLFELVMRFFKIILALKTIADGHYTSGKPCACTS